MRIALIDPSLFTWPYDCSLAEALAANGHEVAIFGSRKSVAAGPSEKAFLRPVFYRGLGQGWIVRLPRWLFLPIKGMHHCVSMFALIRQLKTSRPDIIHFQWAPLPVIDKLFLPAIQTIAPVVLTVHDSMPFNNNPGSGVQRLGAISILSAFDHLIVHTAAAARRLVSYGVAAERVSVLPHGPIGGTGVVTRKHDAAPVLAPAEPVRLLMFGKIKQYKGVDVLLRALSLMPSAVAKRCRVRIVGQPYIDLKPLQEFVRLAALGEIVQFEPRFVGDEEIPDILSAADVMVMPYREIDASGVLMLTLAAGRPIVASKIGLFAELLEDGVHGKLVAVEDHAALALALEHLIIDAEGRRRMGANVRLLHDSIPGWGEIARRTEALYAGLTRMRGQAVMAGGSEA